jgi:hypothetical protein
VEEYAVPDAWLASPLSPWPEAVAQDHQDVWTARLSRLGTLIASTRPSALSRTPSRLRWPHSRAGAAQDQAAVLERPENLPPRVSVVCQRFAFPGRGARGRLSRVSHGRVT